jgi:hypothetical protein
MLPNKKRKLVKFFPITEKRERFPLKVVGTTVGLQLGLGEGLLVNDGIAVGDRVGTLGLGESSLLCWLDGNKLGPEDIITGTEGFQVGWMEPKMVGCLVGTTVGWQVDNSDCGLEETEVERVVGIPDGAVVSEDAGVTWEVGSKVGAELDWLDGVPVGSENLDGSVVGCTEGFPVGEVLGWLVGSTDGPVDGLLEGRELGKRVGNTVGWPVGSVEGEQLGLVVGCAEGREDGALLGWLDGSVDGCVEGNPWGWQVGIPDGQLLGRHEGREDG